MVYKHASILCSALGCMYNDESSSTRIHYLFFIYVYIRTCIHIHTYHIDMVFCAVYMHASILCSALGCIYNDEPSDLLNAKTLPNAALLILRVLIGVCVYTSYRLHAYWFPCAYWFPLCCRLRLWGDKNTRTHAYIYIYIRIYTYIYIYIYIYVCIYNWTVLQIRITPTHPHTHIYMIGVCCRFGLCGDSVGSIQQCEHRWRGACWERQKSKMCVCVC